MSKVKNVETAIRDAERNYSVGRILDAARDFQTVSIILGGMKDYSSAARFAAKSGDCWVECGDPLRASGLYESAAQYFELLSDKDSYQLYYRKALVQCILADRRGEKVGKVALARNLKRAAVCQYKIDQNVAVSQYYRRAAELFVSAAEDDQEKGLFDEGFDLYRSAAECYSQIREYLSEARSLIEALICLNKIFENYLPYSGEEDYKEIIKRELSRFDNTVEDLLKDLEAVDRLDGGILERLVLLLVMSLNVTITLGNGNAEIMRLLEGIGKVVREKGERESGIKILEETIPSFNFSSTRVREEAIKRIERLKNLLEG
jgi:tetratricopeptide (TPR) repeat protein